MTGEVLTTLIGHEINQLLAFGVFMTKTILPRFLRIVLGRHDIQNNDIQNNDILHNDIKRNDIQHNDIQHIEIHHNDI